MFVNVTATTAIYTYLHTLSLHDALPISGPVKPTMCWCDRRTTLIPFTRKPWIARATRAVRWQCVPALKHPYLHSTRSEEHTSELQSLMRISYAVFCLKQKKKNKLTDTHKYQRQYAVQQGYTCYTC